MRRILPLILGGLLLFLPGSASLAEPPKDHEEWQGSIGALWIQYPFDCAVWNEKGKHIFQCHDNDNAVTLTINSPSSDPFLFLEGTVLGNAGEARAVKQGNTLTLSGTYDDQSPSLPLTIGGTAEDFTFSGTYDGTPFQGKGSSTPDALNISLSLIKYIPITGTLDLHRIDNAAAPSSASVSASGSVAFSTNAGAGIILSATGTSTVMSGSTMEAPPPVTLLSSGNIAEATQRAMGNLQEAGQSFSHFSSFLSLVLQTIFAALAVLLLVTFGFLLHHLKNQRAVSSTSPASVRPPPHSTSSAPDQA